MLLPLFPALLLGLFPGPNEEPGFGMTLSLDPELEKSIPGAKKTRQTKEASAMPVNQSPRGKGNASKLTGIVCVRHVLLSSSAFPWTQEFEAMSLRRAASGLSFLESEAKSRGISLSFRQERVRHYLPASPGREVSKQADAIMGEIESTPFARLRTCTTCSSSFDLFHMGETSLASFASVTFPGFRQVTERAFVFARQNKAGRLVAEPAGVFVHEILHLFGAEDFYTPKARATWARKEATNDPMLQGRIPLDEMELSIFTEYAIGWRDSNPGAIPGH